tara:strand:+ start:3284 stop:3454 length:171 start_codon:yes stop_codon:yes gene_type:complete
MGVLIDFGAMLAILHVCLKAYDKGLLVIAVACLAVALWFLFESVMQIIHTTVGQEN